jgi:hypothetical protein
MVDHPDDDLAVVGVSHPGATEREARMTCSTCDDRGFVKDGSVHGMACPDCTDPAVLALLDKIERRPTSSTRARWYTGKKVSDKHRASGEAYIPHSGRRRPT